MRLIKKFYKTIQNVFRRKYSSPYCPYCSSCGETGCCPPTICMNHPKGYYCKTNNTELIIHYRILTEFWNTLDKKEYPLISDKLDELFDRIYDEEYEKLKTVDKKLTIKEKFFKLLKI